MAYATETIGGRGTDTYSTILDCNLNEDTPSYHWPNEERYLQPEATARRFVGYTITFPNHGACTVQNSGWRLFRVFGASFGIEVYTVPRAMDGATATWDEYSTGNAWAAGGALGSGDLGSLVLTQTISPDVDYVFVGNSALDTLVAGALNGGSTLRFLIRRTDSSTTTPRFVTIPTHSNTAVATYFTYDWQASGGGGGGSTGGGAYHHFRNLGVY